MLIGHQDIIKDLARLAKKSELPHGYIFFGSSMVGKRTVAQALANFLENGVFEPPAGSTVLQDAITIAPDEKGTLGIDSVRELKNFLWQKPMVSARRTAVIDGGELLTPEAQNALLKITEEPPRSSLLILVTSDIDGLLPTISSRLQKLYFGTVPEKGIVSWFAESTNKALTKSDFVTIAKRAMGKPGLAWKLIHDSEFREISKSAENLLKLPGEKRRDFVKKLMEDESFDFAKLLDAMILCIAADVVKSFDPAQDLSLPSREREKQRRRWHKFLSLRHDVAYFNLNPKLQLEALLG
ncbi:MAG: hypothetical protein Q8P49_03400 [Candidatus Liptonbacteria bacterium]|nr:hypothetical protein [Candidatus Liptonbacteria bacterium]